ncbi:MAG: hypothetical protein AAGF90_10695 [Pseudomonadota bacterium]
MTKRIAIALLAAAAPLTATAEDRSFWDDVVDAATGVRDGAVEMAEEAEPPRAPKSLVDATDQAGRDASAFGRFVGGVFDGDAAAHSKAPERPPETARGWRN